MPWRSQLADEEHPSGRILQRGGTTFSAQTWIACFVLICGEKKIRVTWALCSITLGSHHNLTSQLTSFTPLAHNKPIQQTYPTHPSIAPDTTCQRKTRAHSLRRRIARSRAYARRLPADLNVRVPCLTISIARRSKLTTVRSCSAARPSQPTVVCLCSEVVTPCPERCADDCRTRWMPSV